MRILETLANIEPSGRVQALILYAYCIFLLFAASGCLLLNSNNPRIQIASEQDGNSITTTIDGKRLILDVHSESGIGSGTVQLNNSSVDKLILRLHLNGLENLSLSNGEAMLTASVSSVDGQSITQSIAKIQPESNQANSADETIIDPTDPLWLPISLPKETQYFEVYVPQDFWMQPGRTLAISWIDFYR